MLPVPRWSNILNASSRLKSVFNAASIFYPSNSLSKNILSFNIFENSAYSILSYDPILPDTASIFLCGCS